jgi:hypothetical protein
MKEALQITNSGLVMVLDITSTTNSLVTLQDAVGGLVQAIDLTEKMTMWCNEEGKMMNLPHNPYAQYFWDKTFGPETDYIVGDIVLTGGTDRFGNTLGLTDQQILDILRLVNFRLATEILGYEPIDG